MIDRVGESAAIALFCSNLYERLGAGRSPTPRRPPPAACSTGPATAATAVGGRGPDLHGYPRAVTR